MSCAVSVTPKNAGLSRCAHALPATSSVMKNRDRLLFRKKNGDMLPFRGLPFRCRCVTSAPLRRESGRRKGNMSLFFIRGPLDHHVVVGAHPRVVGIVARA